MWSPWPSQLGDWDESTAIHLRKALLVSRTALSTHLSGTYWPLFQICFYCWRDPRLMNQKIVSSPQGPSSYSGFQVHCCVCAEPCAVSGPMPDDLFV